MTAHDPARAVFTIAGTERETGLSKDVLRVWERRYGFPRPVRDGRGDRLYPVEQVAKLRLMRRLLDAGQRPSRLIALDVAELHALASAGAGNRPATAAPTTAELTATLLALLSMHDPQALAQALSRQLLRQGLEAFVQSTLAPLVAAVGEAWMRGELQVYDEHLFSEVVRRLLGTAIAGSPRLHPRPSVLLATVSDEPHGLGLMMAEAMLAAEGVHCLSLGTGMPVNEILLAASAHGADVVALSFSAAFPLRTAVDCVLQLRVALPRTSEVWVGGDLTRRIRRSMQGVRVIPALDALLPALAEWRAAHPG